MMRFDSTNLFDRQIAAVGMIAASMWQNGLEIHAGQCDCKKSAEEGFLVIAASDQVRCMICGKPLKLAHIPRYSVEEDKECHCLVIVKHSENEPSAVTASTSRGALH